MGSIQSIRAGIKDHAFFFRVLWEAEYVPSSLPFSIGLLQDFAKKHLLVIAVQNLMSPRLESLYGVGVE